MELAFSNPNRKCREIEEVIAYESKTITSRHNYCTTYRDLLTVNVFVKHFRHFHIE